MPKISFYYVCNRNHNMFGQRRWDDNIMPFGRETLYIDGNLKFSDMLLDRVVCITCTF